MQSEALAPTDPGIDKAAVASRFNRSAETYDDNCRVQRLMADRLVAALEGAGEPARILELGCGTGYLTGLLASRFPQAEIMALDFAGRMVGLARDRVRGRLVQFEVADAETTDFQPERYDLIVSNATVQWFATPGETLSRLAAALRPGASMLHSTFGPATFAELRSVLQDGGRLAGGLPLRPAGEWASMVSGAGLRPYASTAESVTLTYPSAAGFLGELHGTGATWRPNGSGGGPLTPGMLRAALARYDAKFGSPGGVPATYELLGISGSRPVETI